LPAKEERVGRTGVDRNGAVEIRNRLVQLAGIEIGVAARGVGAEEVRPQRERLIEVAEGLGPLAAHRPHAATQCERIGILGVDLGGTVEIGERRIGPAFLPVRHPALEQRSDRPRIELERLLRVGEGLIDVAAPGIGAGAVDIRLHDVGRAARGLGDHRAAARENRFRDLGVAIVEIVGARDGGGQCYRADHDRQPAKPPPPGRVARSYVQFRRL
jgi:hypothetical protein